MLAVLKLSSLEKDVMGISGSISLWVSLIALTGGLSQGFGSYIPVGEGGGGLPYQKNVGAHWKF